MNRLFEALDQQEAQLEAQELQQAAQQAAQREEEPWEREDREHEERRAVAAKERQLFLQKLFGSSDYYDWNAPSPVEDLDVILGEHVAQLRNAVRYTMGRVIADGTSPETQARAATALDRLIRTNLAIAKVLGPAKHAKSKTVHGGPATAEPQD